MTISIVPNFTVISVREYMGLFHSQGHPEAVSFELRKKICVHSLSQRM